MPPDRGGAPQAGGKRKNTEPRARSPPRCQKAVPTTPCAHPDKAHVASAGLATAATELVATDATELVGTDDTELVGTSSKSTGLAAFTHHMEQVSHHLDKVEVNRKATWDANINLRATNATLRTVNATLRHDKAALRTVNAALRVDNAALVVTSETFKASSLRYYDLCVSHGIDVPP